jgi:Ca2+/Na+ antiporter
MQGKVNWITSPLLAYCWQSFAIHNPDPRNIDRIMLMNILPYIMIPAGFALLIKGADLLVDGAAAVARRFHVSDMVIGLTVVAFGTSAPELAVNLLAAAQKTTDIAVGNVVGSNIANILLILGIAGLIRPLRVTSETVWREIPMCLLAAFVLCLLANDRFIDGGIADTLSRIDGLVLLCFFIVFIYYTLAGAMDIRDIDAYAPPTGSESSSEPVFYRPGFGRSGWRRPDDRLWRRNGCPPVGHQ